VITCLNNRLQVSGNVTMDNVNTLFGVGVKAIQGGSVEVDFAQVEKMDSSAVSLMLVWLREAQRNKTKLRFLNVPDNLLSLAKLYGVADLLPLSIAE
jgi:phospholipid transport system transporter-binding protein